jgi:two-component system, cell cycle response regulator
MAPRAFAAPKRVFWYPGRVMADIPKGGPEAKRGVRSGDSGVPPSGGGRLELPVTVRFPSVSSLPPSPEDDQRETEKSLSVPSAPLHRDRASLTLLTGPDAGQVFPLVNESVVGRDFDSQVRIEDAAISRAHARILRLPSGKYVLEDLDSMNGTFVGPERVTRRELVSGDRIQFGPKITVRFGITDEAEEMLQRQLFESSTRDHLTRVYNRRYFMTRLAAEVAHARRHASALALLLLDIDRFKEANDQYGHLVGDAILRSIGDRVVSLIRVEDVFARFGGEEFVVLIRATGPLDGARLAERLRSSIETMKVRAEGVEVGITVSIGVGSLGELELHSGGHELLKLADRRLFSAKEAGRNRVCAS